MHGILIEAHGDASILRVRQLKDPQPKPGEVLVKVAACGVNHLDCWVRKGVPGHTFALPLIPGSDVSGTVEALGEGVTQVKVGDAVVVSPGVSCGVCTLCVGGRDHHCRKFSILGEHRDGGYADKIVVPGVNVLLKPDNLSHPEAAAVGIAFLTAWHMLTVRACVRPGETVLVIAAGSGVGTAAVQIARLWGAQVIATSTQDDKLERVSALGAHHLINSSKQSISRRVAELTGRRGADVVVEHVGPATWAESMKSLAWQGRLVTCGATTGGEVPLNLRQVFFKSLSVLGSTMGSKADFHTVFGHVQRGTLRPVVDRVLPLAQAGLAQELIETRQVFGKVVLTP